MYERKLKRTNGSSVAERLWFILLLAFVLAAVWPYGAVTPSGLLRLELFAFVTAAGAVLFTGRSPRAALVPIVATVAIALVGVVQLVPLDGATAGTLSPAAASAYRQTNAILALFGRPAVPLRLSIAPAETVRASLAIMAYVASFLGSALLLHTRGRRRAALMVLVAACAIQVGYGAAQADDRMHGSFINPNHLAGYCEIGLAAAFALIWAEVVTGRQRVSRRPGSPSVFEQRLLPLSWRMLAWAVIAVGIALSKSRMGIAAAALTTLLLLVASGMHRRSGWRVAGGAAALLAVATLVVATITQELPLVRFLLVDPRDPDADSRLHLWRLSVDAWRQFPHLGSGLGTFREAFRRVQPSDFPGLYEQAHNDALQLLVTGGWIALALAAAAVTSILFLLLRGWWRQQHREEASVALGAAAALGSLLVHGLAEFNFSIPAIPATLCIFLGCGWAAATDLHPNAVTRRSSRAVPLVDVDPDAAVPENA